ncbi:MAG: DUF3846 domain-containing protein [Oscillospiraceae bacterium]|nr:DUF3846 domain-containing protein [Oscillospiraceae bacterium]MBQ9905247.1 DUF3846 domain-containing protein [Oscillospiraceae bacterium]
MIAVKIEPNRKPHLVGIEGSSIVEELHLLQQHVGGYIETILLRDGGVMLVDEDGRMKHSEENLIATVLCGKQILGTVLIVGQNEEMLTDVPSKYYALLAIDMV